MGAQQSLNQFSQAIKPPISTPRHAAVSLKKQISSMLKDPLTRNSSTALPPNFFNNTLKHNVIGHFEKSHP
jgi:hypothetical protein